MHGLFQRQVDVDALQQDQGLLDDQPAVVQGQAANGVHKGGERDRARELGPDGGVQLLQEAGVLRQWIDAVERRQLSLDIVG